MSKVIMQGLSIILVCLAIFIALSKINWIDAGTLDKVRHYERQVGTAYWKAYSGTITLTRDTLLYYPVDTMLSELCNANGIDRNDIHLHVTDNEEINAFTLPGAHLIVHKGLIKTCESQSELAGVLAHELAHIEQNHAMQNVIREIGLNVMLSGGKNTTSEALRTLTSKGFSREMEKEADLKGLRYLAQANADTKGMAAFMRNMAERQKSAHGINLNWLNTHPESQERADYLTKEASKLSTKSLPLIAPLTWEKLKNAVE